MTKTVEIPDEFRERTPVGGYSPDRPMITVTGNRIFILIVAFEAMGEPEAVRCFIDGNRVAIVPADPGRANAYSVHGTDARSEFSGAWLKDELERDTQPEGRFPLERDGDLWVVDFAPEGDDPAQGEPITDGGTLTVCPDCDCTTIERRTDAPDGPTSDGTWYCVACGIHFEEPATRAPKGKQNLNRGYAKRLDRMAPGDLLTNGGGRDE
jgi:ribosomal protein L37AE/L43A